MRIRYFAINVAQNEYRRNRIREQCANYNIPVEIFSAITPETLDTVPNRYDPKRTSRHWGRPLMDTELACGLSHICLWRRLMVDDSADAYVILEDDGTIVADLPALLDAVDFDGIDFLKLSGQHERPEKRVSALLGDHSLVKMAYGPLDTGAYLLTKPGAKRLERYCETMHMSIDVMMDRSYSHGVPVFAIKPYPVESRQNDNPDSPLVSDIGLRRNKYAPNKSEFEKFQTRVLRSCSSFSKRWSELSLFFDRNISKIVKGLAKKKVKIYRFFSIRTGKKYVKSVYGPIMKANWSDKTFNFAVDGSYGPTYAKYLQKIDHVFVFVDVGANQGLYSLIAAKNQHCKGVISFEPIPSTFEYLVDNVKQNGFQTQIATHMSAISEFSGEAKIFFCPDHSGKATLRDESEIGKSTIIKTVSAADLDQILPIGVPIYLKIDVEGHELEVLKEFLKCRAFQNIQSIYYEVDERWVNSESILNLLKEYSFREAGRNGNGRHYDQLVERTPDPSLSKSA